MPPNAVVLSATTAIGGFLAGIIFGRHNAQRLLRRLLKKNFKLLARDEQRALAALAESGQANLFKHWPRPGVRDQEKRALVASATRYLHNASLLLDKERRAVLLEPKTVKKPKLLAVNNDTRVDQFYWLRDDSRSDPEVLQHLKDEDDYTLAVLEPTKELQESLYKELRAAIKEDDQSAPQRHGQYFYYRRTEEGKQYKVHCRRAVPQALGPLPQETDDMDDSVKEEVLLDENEEAKHHSFFILTGLEVSPNHQLMGYGVDTVGGEKYALHFKDLSTGKPLLAKPIVDTAGHFVWANDNKTIFYVRKDKLDRPFQVWKHVIGQGGDDELVYHEEDDAFYVGIGRSRSDKLLLISIGSAITSETRWLDADDPDGLWKVAVPRVSDVEYDLYHWGDYAFMLRRDKEKFNSELLVAPLNNLADAAVTLLEHDPEVKLESLAVSRSHLAVFSRSKGLQRATTYKLERPSADLAGPPQLSAPSTIEFEEGAYTLECGAQGDFDSAILRFVYSSLTTPPTVYDINMDTGNRVLKKMTPILGGFNSNNYRMERQWVTSEDGTEVPMSLVYHKDTPRDGTAPCLLYGYGSYEVSIDPDFDQRQLPLLNRGFVYAIAHIRGGGEMGRQWYENGKLLKKMNTFKDFISCAKYLIEKKYTNAQVLCMEGRSAGGLLIGATLNLAPELFCAAIAGVPFVDCLTTMLDPTIPLTVIEYEEWGNPEQQEYYDYIKSYSPVDNVRRTKYPHLFVSAGLHDPRVGYWEPAKWVAQMRLMKENDTLLLFKCEMGAGHFSKSGRFERLRELALEQAFLLYCVGRTDAAKLA
eukprot:jgi/Botrbrau1/21450/Bobra.0216s0058.1